MSTPDHRPRRAFTLMELLVTIAIILVIATIGYFALPKNMAGDYNRVRGIDQMMEWLLTAKQRAKRDQVPTGIRLVVDSTGLVTSVVYVQQPDALSGQVTGGQCTSTTSGSAGPPAVPATASFQNVDFQGGASTAGQINEALVQPGDYLSVNGGPVHLITGVGAPTGSPPTTTLTLYPSPLSTSPLPTSNYCFYRQPRPISGEDAKQLPTDLAIRIIPITKGPAQIASGNTTIGLGDTSGLYPGDPVVVSDGTNSVQTRIVVVTANSSITVANVAGLNSTTTGTVTDSPSLNVPQNPSTGNYEIVFSQSGAIVGSGTTGGRIVLWMQDMYTGISPPPTVMTNIPISTLIAIQPRTAFIGAFDVTPVTIPDAYAYTEDGRSSGL